METDACAARTPPPSPAVVHIARPQTAPPHTAASGPPDAGQQEEDEEIIAQLPSADAVLVRTRSMTFLRCLQTVLLDFGKRRLPIAEMRSRLYATACTLSAFVFNGENVIFGFAETDRGFHALLLSHKMSPLHEHMPTFMSAIGCEASYVRTVRTQAAFTIRVLPTAQHPRDFVHRHMEFVAAKQLEAGEVEHARYYGLYKAILDMGNLRHDATKRALCTIFAQAGLEVVTER